MDRLVVRDEGIDQYFFLVMIAQKSSKVNSSLVSVWLRMWVLCIISMISSSFMVSPNSRQTRFTFSKSMAPDCSQSQRLNTLYNPSLLLVSPSFEYTTSRKSSKFIFFPRLSRSLIIWNTDSFLLSSPSSCSIFCISSGLMVPTPSSSNRSKVDFSSYRSCSDSFSRAGICGGDDDLLGVLCLISIQIVVTNNR